MATTKNNPRSISHKRYNIFKRKYQYWEHKIIEYKQGLFGENINLLIGFRHKLNEYVEKIKLTKRDMYKFNREWGIEHKC